MERVPEPGLTFPNVSFFLKASPAFGQRRFHQKKKNTDFFCAFVLAPASFLTFGKVSPGPPQTDIFLGRGTLSTPPPSFLSAPGPPQIDILLGGGGRSPPGVVLDIGEGQLS